MFTDLLESVYHVKPLGAYSLATTLRNNGYSTLVVDHFARYVRNPELLRDVILRAVGHNTIAIGFSSTFFSDKLPDEVNFDSWSNFREAWTEAYCGGEHEISLLQKIIKNKYPNIKFIYGGHGAQRELFLTETKVKLDYIVKGYADTSFIKLLKHIESNTPVDTKNINGTYIIEDKFFPDTFNFSKHATVYQPHDVVLSGEVLPIETNRGCMYNCTFCDFPLRGRKRNNSDYHTTEENLYQSFVDNYNKYKVTKYSIVDDTFNETTDKLRMFNKTVKKTNIPLEFSAWARLDLIGNDFEQIDLLIDSGVKSLWFGIESLNDQSLHAIRKKYSGDFTKKTLLEIRKRAGPDFRIYASFILGLPGETKETIDEWMHWVIHESPIDFIEVRGLNILDNQRSWPSSFAQNPKKFGYTILSDEKYRIRPWKTETMTFDEATQIAKYYNDLLWNTGRNKLASFDLFGIMNHGYSFEELKDIPVNNLPFDNIVQRGKEMFDRYHVELIRQIS